MFKTLPAFSPTGNPKRLPATTANLVKYEKYLTSLQSYIAKSEELGHYIDATERAKFNKLFGTTTTDSKGFNMNTDFRNTQKK